MKHFILLLLIVTVSNSLLKAQKVDSIYVNLYTDSLKKGTYNYINIDGLLSNGRYMPLDSSHLIFSCSVGRFSGNSLWLDPNFAADKVSIKVVLRNNPAIQKEFDVYIKKKNDNERLKTSDEIMDEMRGSRKSKRGRN